MDKVEIKKVDAFNIKIGKEDFGEFTVDSEWEGFRKLANKGGLIAIISSDQPKMFESVFNCDYWVVKASPDIMSAIKELKESQEDERKSDEEIHDVGKEYKVVINDQLKVFLSKEINEEGYRFVKRQDGRYQHTTTANIIDFSPAWVDMLVEIPKGGNE
ncbi:hypothetical protein KAR91_81250 [Candidatus Pacearchaeota archaeon]|nr:hypothetical protein [Candidatus Pacearchaeota archaeon]